MVPTLPRRLSAACALAALAWGFVLLDGELGCEATSLCRYARCGAML